jgi:16S rRNA (cytidine1402-2'-O)-methyltransferase
VVRGDLADLAAHYADISAPKGEIVIVVGPPAAPPELTVEFLDARLTELLQSASVRDAASQLAAESGLARRDLYTRALLLSGDKHE